MVVTVQPALHPTEDAFAGPVFIRTTIGEYFKICLDSPGSFKYDQRSSCCEEERELAGQPMGSLFSVSLSNDWQRLTHLIRQSVCTITATQSKKKLPFLCH
jgi:hypothetical protein